MAAVAHSLLAVQSPTALRHLARAVYRASPKFLLVPGNGIPHEISLPEPCSMPRSKALGCARIIDSMAQLITCQVPACFLCEPLRHTFVQIDEVLPKSAVAAASRVRTRLRGLIKMLEEVLGRLSIGTILEWLCKGAKGWHLGHHTNVPTAIEGRFVLVILIPTIWDI